MRSGTRASVPLEQCVLVMAHGAGSSAQFLADAFPASRVGVRSGQFLDDRTGDLTAITTALSRACAEIDGPVVVGGVSLGAHAAATLLTSGGPPDNVVGGLLVMPAWTGSPDRVAGLTAAAAGAVAALTPAGVLADLDAGDWVTPQLEAAWALRDAETLVAELDMAATQSAPALEDLARIRVPVGLVALRSDPLHPEAVARQWAQAIPRCALVTLGRDEPAHDLAVFAERTREALTKARAEKR